MPGYEMDAEEIVELERRDAEVESSEYDTHEAFLQIMHEELSQYKNRHG